MAQIITPVESPHIEHGVLIDLIIPDVDTGAESVYYISNCYTNISYLSRTYLALGNFLGIGDIQGDLQSTNNEVVVSLSGIPSKDESLDVIQTVLKQQIKGSKIKMYRAFFDTETQQVIEVSGVKQIFLRFDGIISNFAVQEDFSSDVGSSLDVSHTVTVTASSILSVIENRVSGRRTNEQSYQRQYGEQFINGFILTDPAMNRVVSLKAATFDFGKKE
jgi:hypothetical protein